MTFPKNLGSEAVRSRNSNKIDKGCWFVQPSKYANKFRTQSPDV